MMVRNCVLFTILLGCATAQEEITVNTTKGKLRGQTFVVQSTGFPENRIVSKFLGVPYAKPPVGNLRFQAPLPHDEWDGVRNVTSYGNGCGQFYPQDFDFLGLKAGLYGDEDCLYLNIFVPGDATNMTETLPVMFWIYGGGFFVGFSHQFDPTQMALLGKVIVVTFNYRLGALGFLSFKDSTLTSSNNALRDQIMALNWVKENIANFGGNPNEVTIFGESAGGISVSLLLVSPHSNGLIKRAIIQSGALNVLPIQNKWIQNKCHSKEQLNFANKSLIPKSNCTSSDVSKIIACLKTVSFNTIVTHQFDNDIINIDLIWANRFIPCYGDDVIPIKWMDPLRLFEIHGQLHVKDVLIGGNNDDGSFAFNFFDTVNKNTYDKSLENLSKTFYQLEWERVYAAVRHEYIPDDPTTYNRQLLNAQTDRLLADYQVLADEISSHKGSVYHYIFNYSPNYIQFGPSWIQGGHSEELFLEFGNVLELNFSTQNNFTVTPEDREVAKTLVTVFTNFAKTGDPNDASLPVTWPKYNVTNRHSLEITPNMNSDNVKSNPRRKAMDFWNKLIPLLAEPDVCPVPTTGAPPTTITPPRNCSSLPGCVSDVIVNTTSGQLRGYVFLVRTDNVPEARQITKFLGIPYAKPPTNNLRFAPPVKTDSWDGVRNAIIFGNVCPQIVPAAFGFVTTGPTGNEDCLTLNVYTPGNINDVTEPLSVMVWIHGGGLILGSGSQYDPTQLALHGNVIIVTINYRLGIFSRMSTSGTYSNNYLNDQILALKWVQENIANFGGNPSDVTIFGESAGGISVNYLLISPLANGLFKRAISQSAVLTNDLPSLENCSTRQYLKKLAKRVNCTSESMTDIQCFMNTSQDTLLNYQFSDNYGELIIDITVESVPLCYGDDVLPHSPIEMFKTGKMHNTTESVIIGGNNDEGAFAFNTFAPVNRTIFENQLSANLQLVRIPNHEKVLPIVLHEYAPYTEHEMYNRQTMNGISDQMHADIIKVADVISSYDYQPKVYHYIYNYIPSPNVPRVYGDWVQAGHGEELLAEFGFPVDPNFPVPFSPTDKDVSRTIMTLFTNFAKTGNPNPLSGSNAGVTWPLYNATSRYSLEITGNITSDSVISHPRRKGVEFWNVIIPTILKLQQCPAPDTTIFVAHPTTSDKNCQVSIGPLFLTPEAANQLLWGLGFALGFMVIFVFILLAAVVMYYRRSNSVDTKL